MKSGLKVVYETSSNERGLPNYGLMELETLIRSLKFDLNSELYISELNDYQNIL